VPSLRHLLRRWPSPGDRIALGAFGERVAARHLRRRGYRIIVRDYRCDLGQIDLIAAQGAMLVFVEVKTRGGDDKPFDGANPVHSEQREQIVRAAKYFLRHPAAHDRPARFDVVMVSVSSEGKTHVEHEEDAWRS